MHDLHFNKGRPNITLTPIKFIFGSLMISWCNGNVWVCLHGVTEFESCPMHVIDILIFYYIYLFILKSDIYIYFT